MNVPVALAACGCRGSYCRNRPGAVSQSGGLSVSWTRARESARGRGAGACCGADYVRSHRDEIVGATSGARIERELRGIGAGADRRVGTERGGPVAVDRVVDMRAVVFTSRVPNDGGALERRRGVLRFGRATHFERAERAVAILRWGRVQVAAQPLLLVARLLHRRDEVLARCRRREDQMAAAPVGNERSSGVVRLLAGYVRGYRSPRQNRDHQPPKLRLFLIRAKLPAAPVRAGVTPVSPRTPQRLHPDPLLVT